MRRLRPIISALFEENKMDWKDPIHQNAEGKWCFWDEVWANEIGSYDTEEEAFAALREYGEYLDSLDAPYGGDKYHR